jgi:hypothetical protein
MPAAHCVVDDRLAPKDVKYVAVGLLSFQTDKTTDYEWIKVTVRRARCCCSPQRHEPFVLGRGAHASPPPPHADGTFCHAPPSQKIVRHASYNASSIANDIAVLVLERAARTKPAQLAASTLALKPVDTQPSTGDWLYAAGWGTTEANKSATHLMCACSAEGTLLAASCCTLLHLAASGCCMTARTPCTPLHTAPELPTMTRSHLPNISPAAQVCLLTLRVPRHLYLHVPLHHRLHLPHLPSVCWLRRCGPQARCPEPLRPTQHLLR